MGSITAQSRGSSFTQEFDNDLVSGNGFDTNVAYELALQSLGYDPIAQVVRMFAALIPVGPVGGDEIEVSIGDVIYDPNAPVDDLVEQLVLLLREPDMDEGGMVVLEEETVKRLNEIGLAGN